MKLTVKFAGIFAVLAFALTAVTADAAFTRDLTVGSTGSDVMELQQWLNSKGFTVAATGAGSVGMETSYFGPATQAALAKWQAANGVTPAAGYFGPITRAKIAAAGPTTPTTPTTPGSNNDLSGDEASLEQFDLSAGDDSDVEEGASAEIAEIEFDVEDGDASIDRIDLALVGSGEETDPWDAFDSVRLLVDGDEIAEMDLSDEDAYLDEDLGTIRLSNIDYVAREGDTVKIVVELTAQNSVDGADNDDAAWEILVEDDGIRATDAEGIQQYIGTDTDTVSFEIVVEGDGEELKVSSSTEDPEATTLSVDEESKSEAYGIFAFELEAEESDIELDTVEINVDTTTADVNDVVSEFTLEIDGEEFDDWSFVDGDDGATTTATIEFDIDGDYTLDADSEVTVVLMAEFKAANGTNYATTGETVAADIAAGAIDAEGADDLVSTGVATGEEHDLEIAGLVVDEAGFDYVSYTKSNDEGTIGVFKFTFEVTAFEEDFYIATSSITTFLDGPGIATTSVSVASTGDEDNDDVFTVEEGETETFTVTVSISNASVAGQYRVGLDSVMFTENSDGVTARTTKDVVNSDFRTDFEQVN